MSTPVPTTPSGPPATREIRIVSHSNLFYWWPVWAVGFLMAVLTFLENHRVVLVPSDTKIQQIEGVGNTKRFELSFNKDVPDYLTNALDKEKAGDDNHALPLRLSETKAFGAIFEVVLLLVIIITNAPLRGMWSILVVVVGIMLAIIFSLAQWWTPIITTISHMHGIHLDFSAYFFLSSVLFVIWLIGFLFLDQQIYMVFTPGQLKVRLEIGGGEKVYDTMGMTIEKQRSDLFRHWILGLGSGDLIVNTSGAQAHHFDLPNVLFIGRKVEQIEEMLREKKVV